MSERTPVTVEVTVADVAGLEVAARAGAHRIELCTAPERGGATADAELVAAARHRLDALLTEQRARPGLELHALIRLGATAEVDPTDPAPFRYEGPAVSEMAAQAAAAVHAGAHGVVIGALNEHGGLDVPALESIRDAALQAGQEELRGVGLTARRAVDALPDRDARVEAVQQLLGLGFHRVLSSGGALRALDGAADLAAMVEASEELIEICAGAGVRPAHLAELVRATGVPAVHLSARRAAASPREAAAPDTATDPAIVAAAVDAAGAL